MGLFDSLNESPLLKGALGQLEASVLPVVLSEVMGNGSDGGLNAIVAKLENPHYQLRIEIESQGPNQTLVSVIAKITAWNAEEDPSRSQYVVVPSNGRLEQDLLDRLSVLLEKGSGGLAADRAAAAPPSDTVSSSSPTPPDAPGGNAPCAARALARGGGAPGISFIDRTTPPGVVR